MNSNFEDELAEAMGYQNVDDALLKNLDRFSEEEKEKIKKLMGGKKNENRTSQEIS